ncbi:hypothetical protein [Mycobacterium sp. SMC-4]|uniref:hypothetical protein n=1 Tax=Mycobacterium sp. SMC-4 TaxID=2857059 RepID=UPI0021B49388|nr:hypothetical protein [Mycobacterium sp. SMC-4]UXA19085.1 hypothetical protein KXD98_05380 [Mycobacterium sp. SMC-4]
MLSALTLLTACSNSGQEVAPTTIGASAEMPPTSLAPPAAEGAAAESFDFEGPVLLFCEDLSMRSEKIPSTISIKKLDLGSRRLVDVAQYPEGLMSKGCKLNTPNTVGEYIRFAAQEYRHRFSRDFQKMLVDARRNGEVAYYDLSKGQLVVVNDLIPHPTGDFDQDPSYSSPSFTDDGLLMFAEGYQWKYFDTDTQTVVRESSEPEVPKFWPPSVPQEEIGWGSLNRCFAAWALPGDRYIEASFASASIYSLPVRNGNDLKACGEEIQRITPDGARIHVLAANSSGTEILMLVSGRDNANKLYRANLQNRNEPTEIDLNGALGRGPNPYISIIGWE